MPPKSYREELGLTVAEMAELIGVHHMTWRKWESGERKPGASTVRLLDLLIWLKAEHPNVFAELLNETFEN